MKKFFIFLMIAAICAGFTSCAPNAPVRPVSESESGLEPPLQTPRDIESMIEPLEDARRPSSSDENASASESSGHAESGKSGSGDTATAAQVEKEPAKTQSSSGTASYLAGREDAVLSGINSESTDGTEPGLLDEARLDTEIIERELLRLINAERTQLGTEALGVEESMRFAARIRASEALEGLTHTRPNGSSYYTAFDEAGFLYAGKYHGENLSSLHFTPGMLDEAAIARELFANLKNSPGNYQNMVSDNFLQTGIGAAINHDGNMIGVVSVQLFSSL